MNITVMYRKLTFNKVHYLGSWKTSCVEKLLSPSTTPLVVK